MEQNKSGLTYKSSIMSYFFRITECTVIKRPIDNIIDVLWALLDSFSNETDHTMWREYAKGRDYASTMWKLRIISLLLYRINVLPQRPKLQNRQFKIVKGEKTEVSGLQSWVVEDLELANFINRHLIHNSYIAKRQMDDTMHIDVLWFILSPYVDEEAFSDWELTNEKYGNINSRHYDIYICNIEKIKIISQVLYRADFQFSEAHEDSPKNVWEH